MVTVSNKKVETVSQKSDLTARLGSPKGEKEKGEVRPTIRKDPVVKEPRAAHDLKDDRPHTVVEKVKRSDRCEELDSSLDKPFKKKTRKNKETSSSGSESSDTSSDDDGEPMTKDRVTLQSMKVELEMNKLMKFKKRYKKERKLQKKQSKSEKDTSSE